MSLAGLSYPLGVSTMKLLSVNLSARPTHFLMASNPRKPWSLPHFLGSQVLHAKVPNQVLRSLATNISNDDHEPPQSRRISPTCVLPTPLHQTPPRILLDMAWQKRRMTDSQSLLVVATGGQKPARIQIISKFLAAQSPIADLLHAHLYQRPLQRITQYCQVLLRDPRKVQGSVRSLATVAMICQVLTITMT